MRENPDQNKYEYSRISRSDTFSNVQIYKTPNPENFCDFVFTSAKILSDISKDFSSATIKYPVISRSSVNLFVETG